MRNFIKWLFKPIFDEEWNRAFSAGVNAERLVKAKSDSEREYDILKRGKELGRLELIEELESDIQEIGTEEFNQLANMVDDKPFGFVGTIDDLQLVLEGEA